MLPIHSGGIWSTHAEQAQCVAGRAEPIADFGKASVSDILKSQQ